MARSYLRQAEERLKPGKEAFEDGNYPYTIRECQEAVELSLKAALRIVGIEPPKIHDVGPLLRKNLHLFPDWFKQNINRMATISR
ncbi:MAG: HEPN domain-containing protein [Candidatus Aenigmatarchaeota archaeon]